MHAPGPGVARRDLGAVPRLHADRPRRGLRHHADLGERRHHRPVRRDALRRQRHEVPVQGPVPDDGHLQRRHARTATRSRSRPPCTGRSIGYATVNGQEGRDLVEALELRQGRRSTCSSTAGSPTARCTSPKSFFKAAAQTPQTFNSFYIDNKHIAEYTAGKLPIRAEERRPRPADQGHRASTSGQGFLDARATIHRASTRADGTMTNWNQIAAHGFGAADDEWGRNGSVERVDLLNKNLERLASRTASGRWPTVTSAMNAAATQDVRAIDTVPLLQRAAEGLDGPERRRRADARSCWSPGSNDGGSRLDREPRRQDRRPRRGDHGRLLDRRSPTRS